MIKNIKFYLIAAFTSISNLAFANTSDSKIKLCLASIYLAQDNFHRANRRYAEATDLKQIDACSGFKLSADYADAAEFKIIAKSDTQAWSVDDSKRVEEVTE